MDEALRQDLTLGREYYLRGDHVKAKDYLESVAERAPTFADVFNMLGIVYHGLGQFSKAQRAFETALKVNPQYSEAALNLSVLYNDLGKYEEARQIYNHALRMTKQRQQEMDSFVAGKLANMHSDTGDAYLSAGMHRQAVEEFKKALSLRPTFVDIRLKLANALRDSSDLEGAIGEYVRALKDKPDYVPARLSLGLAYYAQGKADLARQEWEDILRRDGKNERARIYLNMATPSA